MTNKLQVTYDAKLSGNPGKKDAAESGQSTL